MNTAELVAKIADAHGVSKVQAKSIVDDIFKDIVDAAASGAEDVATGVREVRKSRRRRSARGLNPANGEKIKIAASKEAHLLVRCQSVKTS